MSEEIVKAAGFLRKNGGYSLTVTPHQDSFVVTGYFKDVGSYGTTVSYAAASGDLDTAQDACILGLAKLVHYTQAEKPTVNKPAAAAPTGGAIVSLKGLEDSQWGKAKDLVKDAGFRFDKDSKNWIGGDIDKLPDWLKKRTKGGSSNGNGSYSNGAKSNGSFYKKKAEPEQEEYSSNQKEETASFLDTDDIPF